MPDSQVPTITLNQDGTINIQVDVYGFEAGTPIKISGQATQESGAVASFYSVQAVPPHADDENAVMWVKNVPVVAPKQFDPHFDATITVEAAQTWTVEMKGNADPVAISRAPGEPVPRGGWTSTIFGPAVEPLPPAATASAPAPVVPA